MRARSFLILVTSMAMGVPSLAQVAPPIHGWLHTQGQRILDERGKPVRFCGVNLSGLEWGAGTPWTTSGCSTRAWGCYSPPPPDAAARIASWGFNVVRLPVSWSNMEPDPPEHRDGRLLHHYNTAYLGTLDQVIAQCRQNGLAVILSFHQWGWSPHFHLQKSGTGDVIHGCGLPAWLFEGFEGDVAQARRDFFADRAGVQEGVAEVWRFLARRYADDSTVVGADLFNEPDATDYARGKVVEEFDLDDLYRKLGEAVRSEDSHLLLIVEEGRGTHLKAAPPFQGVIYSFHEYPHGWTPGIDPWTRDRLARAGRWSLPIWVGEFQRIGPKGLHGDPEGLDQTRQMLDFFRSEGIGWSYWAYSRAARPLYGESGRGPSEPALIGLLRSGF